MGDPPDWGLGEALTTPPREKIWLRNNHGRDAFSGDKTIRRFLFAGARGYGNEFLGSIKCGEFLD